MIARGQIAPNNEAHAIVSNENTVHEIDNHFRQGIKRVVFRFKEAEDIIWVEAYYCGGHNYDKE